MTTIWRIHTKDNMGDFSVDCYDYEEYCDTLDNYKSDPECYDFWVEEYDDEEGWQA